MGRLPALLRHVAASGGDRRRRDAPKYKIRRRSTSTSTSSSVALLTSREVSPVVLADWRLLLFNEVMCYDRLVLLFLPIYLSLCSRNRLSKNHHSDAAPNLRL
mmetsp:Transcript_323/g.995  ORF Transcript_323/g.995 Transcript_323/m.995 type:complete len:103 (+) Transcript_323:241-549(+)